MLGILLKIIFVPNIIFAGNPEEVWDGIDFSQPCEHRNWYQAGIL